MEIYGTFTGTEVPRGEARGGNVRGEEDFPRGQGCNTFVDTKLTEISRFCRLFGNEEIGEPIVFHQHNKFRSSSFVFFYFENNNLTKI